MYYCFDGGAGKLYNRTLEKAVEAAVELHMRKGMDYNRVTVYECLTDRIVWQWCYVCQRPTEWCWPHQFKDRQGIGGIEKAQCGRCGNQCSEEIPTVCTNDDPIRTLAMLFELHTNMGFNCLNLLQEMKKHSPSPTIRVGQAIQLFINLLDKKRKVKVIQQVQSPETIKVSMLTLGAVMRRMNVDEMRTRMMDANALQGLEEEVNDSNM